MEFNLQENPLDEILLTWNWNANESNWIQLEVISSIFLILDMMVLTDMRSGIWTWTHLCLYFHTRLPNVFKSTPGWCGLRVVQVVAHLKSCIVEYTKVSLQLLAYGISLFPWWEIPAFGRHAFKSSVVEIYLEFLEMELGNQSINSIQSTQGT